MAVTEAGGGVVVTSGSFGLQGKFSATDINEYVNPAADPRLNSILAKTGSPLRQGIIQQHDSNVIGPQRYPYACRFMFNPTTLSVGYQALEGTIDPAEQTAAQAAATNVAAGQTTLSFNLLFDRTYEVAYKSGQKSLAQLGVYRDVAALENVVKARNNFATSKAGVITPMALVPCYFVFGGGNGNVGLSFIGAITSFSVTYSTFSSSMVPMRAGVELSVTQHLGRDFDEFVQKGGTLVQRAANQRRDNASARNRRGN